MEKILSIIVPTYNMEKYLRRCLDSLIVSDENMQRLEVLVINDGSKDSSSQIAHEYEAKYPQTFRVIDKENGNYGSCINRGLKEATGKYVKVLDADDSFDTDSFEQFLKLLLEIEADLILSDFSIVNENDIITEHKTYPFVSGKILNFDDICASISFKAMQMHAVTYKRQNLIDIQYRQTEGISYTDQEWISIPMTTVKTVYYAKIEVYKYLVGRSGQTMDLRVKIKSVDHTSICVVNRVKEIYKRGIDLNSPVGEYLTYILCNSASWVYKCGVLLDSYNLDKLREFDDYILNNTPLIYNNLNSLVIHKLLPFAYIRYYRNKRKTANGLIKYLYKLYSSKKATL